jgi:hypothetical protein
MFTAFLIYGTCFSFISSCKSPVKQRKFAGWEDVPASSLNAIQYSNQQLNLRVCLVEMLVVGKWHSNLRPGHLPNLRIFAA